MDELKLLSILAILCNASYAGTNLFFYVDETFEGVTELSEGLEISIRQWLGITALFELTYIAFALFTLIAAQVSAQKNNFLLLIVLCHKFFHAIFQLAWLILGTIIHWKDKLGTSSSRLDLYLKIVLIQLLLLAFQWGFWLYYFKNKEEGVLKRLSIAIPRKSKKSLKSISLRSDRKTRKEKIHLTLSNE